MKKAIFDEIRYETFKKMALKLKSNKDVFKSKILIEMSFIFNRSFYNKAKDI